MTDNIFFLTIRAFSKILKKMFKTPIGVLKMNYEMIEYGVYQKIKRGQEAGWVIKCFLKGDKHFEKN